MKDGLSNKLEVGDLVLIKVGQEWIKGRVKGFQTGGTLIPVNKQQAQMTPAQVEVECICFSQADPANPMFLNVLKLVDPNKKTIPGATIN